METAVVASRPDQLERDLAAILGIGGAPATGDEGRARRGGRSGARIAAAGAVALLAAVSAIVIVGQTPRPPRAATGMPPPHDIAPRRARPPAFAPVATPAPQGPVAAAVPPPQFAALRSAPRDRDASASHTGRHTAKKAVADRATIVSADRGTHRGEPRQLASRPVQTSPARSAVPDAPAPSPVEAAADPTARAASAASFDDRRIAMASPTPAASADGSASFEARASDPTKPKRVPRKLESIDAIRLLRRQ